MKFFKTILVSLALMIACSIGVLADETITTPTQYINGNGVPTNVTFDGQIGTSSGSTGLATQELSQVSELTPSATGTGNWYLATGTTVGTTETITNGITIKTNTPGTVNIVVGPNGKSGTANTATLPAVSINGTLTIPAGVTVNIFQAANGLGTDGTSPAASNQCVLQIGNSAATPAVSGKTTTPSPGVIVNSNSGSNAAAGTLNVQSGSLWCYGIAATEDALAEGETPDQSGITINGNVTVGTYGTLIGKAASQTDQDSEDTPTAYAINIGPNGSLTTNGTLVASAGPGTATGNPIVGGSINNMPKLTVNNGLVISTDTYQTASTPNTGAKLNNGIWSWAATTTGSSTNTVFGDALWVETGIRMQLSDANLTVPEGNSLTLANAYNGFDTWDFNTSANPSGTLIVDGTLNIGVPENSTQPVNPYFTGGTGSPYAAPTVSFGSSPTAQPSASGAKANGTLSIGSSGILNIASNATVNMYADSMLTNNGTINVAPSSSAS